jgi:Cu2+-exporting ATPase
MDSHGSRRPALAFGLCAAALLSVACFGQPSTQPAPTTAPAGAPPGASPSPAVSPSPLASPAASPSPAAGEQRYTVEVGDTLGTIAQKFYGDPTQWRKIYEANRSAVGDNPDAIRVGTELRIPP